MCFKKRYIYIIYTYSTLSLSLDTFQQSETCETLKWTVSVGSPAKMNHLLAPHETNGNKIIYNH